MKAKSHSISIGVAQVLLLCLALLGLFIDDLESQSTNLVFSFCDSEEFKASTRIAARSLSFIVTGKLSANEEVKKIVLKDEQHQHFAMNLAFEEMFDKSLKAIFCKKKFSYQISVQIPISSIPFDQHKLVVNAVTDSGTKPIGILFFKRDKPIGYVESVNPVGRTINTISGWAISANGPVTIQLIVKGRSIAETRTGISRQDVADVYKHWPDAASSGFSMVVPFAELEPGTHDTQIRFIDSQGRSQMMKGPVIDNDHAFALVESKPKPIVLGAKNVVSGWAVGKRGEVTVRIRVGDSVVATVKANGNRSDVGNVFKHWERANQSGFQWLVPFRELPRGRYPLVLEFVEDGEVFQVSEGPLVQNDRPVGRVISDRWRMIDPERMNVVVWVADEDGISTVELYADPGKGRIPMRLVKSPVSYEQVRKSGEDELGPPSTAVQEGQLFEGKPGADLFAEGLSRIFVRVVDRAGSVSILPGPLVLSEGGAVQPCIGDPVRLYFPGDTRFWRKGAPELNELRRLFGSSCIEVGMQSRVEYLRTTKGKEQDYLFDPDFPDDQRVSKKGVMLSTALNEVLGYADQWKLPLMVTLDGGVWADSAFSAADVDLVDMLEMDERNVQWNQFGRTEPDDALSDLPGSFGSPELARMMSLNWYNRDFHRYKKRNLMAAVDTIRNSGFVKSGGQVSINMDPDQYINPWFYKNQWYDYNPDTLRQFREWLMHEGVYSGAGALSGQGATDRLTLDEINSIAGQEWHRAEQIDPPRKKLDYDDPWHQLWTQFKRHLVDLHYDQLSGWAAEAGMPADNIYTSQTFIQTDVAETIYDRASGWPDEAGVSIEGAAPSHGHLGAILYGAASRDDGPSRSGGSMFDTIQRIDSKWGVVELNPATIAFPEWVADHDASYRTVGNILNAGARFMTPMWGSHMGDLMTYPDTFRSYDAFTGTPFEYQLVWWLLGRRNLPVGSVNYPFGNEQVLSADGWDTVSDTTMEMQKGSIHLAGDSKPMLKSPENLMVSVDRGARITIKGDWCEKGSLEADLTLSDGSNNRIGFIREPDGIRADIPAFKGLELHSLSLIWNLEFCDDHTDVIIDNLSIVPFNKPSTIAER